MRIRGILLLLLLLLRLLLSCELSAQPVRIWSGTPVRAREVMLTPYLPDIPGPAPAVIVCPGGSYFWLDVEHEGEMVAEWLRREGFAAFLLQYRTGGWFNFVFHSRWMLDGYRFPDMMEDIQRAIQLVRQGASGYGVNPDRVGVMGFSAGGHLVMLSAELADTDFLAKQGIEAGVSLRPDFVAPIYPVVTLQDREETHKRSRRGLLGEGRTHNLSLRDSLSLEKHVHPGLPPVFLLNCVDDPIVDYRNSELLDSALTANKVPHLYVQYKIGGHGFGADPEKFSDETKQWQATFLHWFNDLITKKNDE